jgi:predicted amidohydrolase YtcJ
VGYHESVAGELDRWQLDEWLPDRPVKIQHRSGKLWIVNSLAARYLALDAHAHLAGVELDHSGRPNGRLFRLDDWMREQQSKVSPDDFPSLSGISRQLASYGVTGVTDASPDNSAGTLHRLARAATAGELLQAVRVMGAEDLPPFALGAQLECGERKVMLDEDALPDWDALCDVFRRSHQQGRAVAVHCVTAAELVLTLSALREVGPLRGDRIEHASLVPREVLPLLREVGVRVVTQPGFIYERGDQYAQEIDPADHNNLYRCRALLAQGIPLAGSTDAPYGDPDPWAAMRAAVQRNSRSGTCLGAGENLSPEQALALFTSAADDPGGASRAVSPGGAADLCLLSRRWEDARLSLRSEDVRATIRCGELIYLRESLLEESTPYVSALE